jgi:LmbE family N-acetylglucosaminyl deacetylase
MKRALLAASVFLAAALPAFSGDDHYKFGPAAGEEHKVELAAADTGLRFAWPKASAADWDTALLGVQVSAPGAGGWVELVAGAGLVKQYFDADAHGLRFLNLTGLRGELREGTAVEVRVHNAAIVAGPASLRLFANRIDWTKPILIVAPHPDDAEIAAFGVYSGSNATIVTVTSGNAGDANYKDDFPDMAEQYLFKGYIRAVDSVTVPWQGGIPPERCFNLGYFDARLETMHGKPAEVVPELYGPNDDTAPYRKADVGHLLPTTSRKNSWANLVADLQAVLKKVNPGIIVMPNPFLDGHWDHEFASVALVEAMGQWSGSPRFLVYTNHTDHNLYPYGPAGTTMSVPPWQGPELPIDGVFAKTVSADLQRHKLYALESMHDLRLSPTEQKGCLPPGTPPLRPDYPREYSVDYFRRGPRSEEFFFVYDRKGATELIQSFLTSHKASAE